MEPTRDSQGFLTKVQGRFAYGRDESLTRWNGQLWLHIFDSSKCRQQNGSYDKTQRKSLSFRWSDALTLKDCLSELESYAPKIEREQVRIFLRNSFEFHF